VYASNAHLVTTKGASDGGPVCKRCVVPWVSRVQTLEQRLGRVQDHTAFATGVSANTELSIIDECPVNPSDVIRRLLVQVQATQFLPKLEFLLLIRIVESAAL
jgi:hypothetical protein